MKNITLYPMILLLFFSCEIKKDKYEFENNLLDCFYSDCDRQNLPIKKSLDSLELLLIKHQVLADNTGKGKVEFLNKIIHSYSVPKNSDKDLSMEINKIKGIPLNFQCSDITTLKDIDSALFYNSRLKNMEAVFDEITKMGDISPYSISKEILKYFNEEDFDNEFYRVTSLIIIKQLYKEQDRGILDLLENPNN